MIQPEPEGSTQGYPLVSVDVLRYVNKRSSIINRFEGTNKDGNGDFRYSDAVRPSRSDEVLKLKNFEKDASLQLSSYQIKKDLKTKFLNKYCPPGRTAKKIEEINNFQQEQDETLYQAWEHFKELLMKYPQHYLTEMQEVILFYNGLDVLTRQILDSRGAAPTKTAEDAKKAIQEMAEYSQKWHNRTYRGRSTETSDGLAAIQA
ncbi:hypothetical protein Tco_0188734 [Tanacetum coccineum]